MKKSLFWTSFGSLLALLVLPASAQTDFYTANTPLSTPKTYSGNLGIRLGLEATRVPGGATVYVTDLGFYAGKSGDFTGAGVVDFDHTLSLWGPQTWSSRAGDYSALSLASVTLQAGAAVDSDGFAWVTLSTPVALVLSQYYVLMGSFVSAQTADPYFDPYAGPAGAASILYTPGQPFVDTIGRWGLGSGQEAYSYSGYLGPNLKYSIVPEPATALIGLLGGLSALVLARRRPR